MASIPRKCCSSLATRGRKSASCAIAAQSRDGSRARDSIDHEHAIFLLVKVERLPVGGERWRFHVSGYRLDFYRLSIWLRFLGAGCSIDRESCRQVCWIHPGEKKFEPRR